MLDLVTSWQWTPSPTVDAQKNVRPDRETVLGLSVLGHCRNVAVQHGGLCVRGSVLSHTASLKPRITSENNRLPKSYPLTLLCRLLLTIAGAVSSYRRSRSFTVANLGFNRAARKIILPLLAITVWVKLVTNAWTFQIQCFQPKICSVLMESYLFKWTYLLSLGSVHVPQRQSWFWGNNKTMIVSFRWLYPDENIIVNVIFHCCQ